MQDDLRAVMDELQAAIQRSEVDGVIDDVERAELRTLVDKLGSLLDDPDEREGAIEHLEEYAIKFEGRHPTVAAVIRSAVDTLAGYGI